MMKVPSVVRFGTAPLAPELVPHFPGIRSRELLDHVIPLNEQHLRRLGREYLAYYNYASHCPTFLCV